jgi:glycosyltransferase involved in cell wall biosynthesis
MKNICSPRLLLIHQNFVTAHEAGNSRAINLVAELLRTGWAVDIVASDKTYLGDPAASTSKVEREGQLTIYRIPSPQGTTTNTRARSYASFARSALLLFGSLEKPTVVFATTPPLPQVLVSMAASVRWQCPLALEVRDLWPSFLEQGGLLSNSLLISALRWIESLIYRYADIHIVVAPAFAPFLQQMGVPLQNIIVAPTGGDPTLYNLNSETKAEKRRSLGWEGKLVLIYTGSLNEPYGIDLLLKASQCELSDDVLWVFVGNGRCRDLVEKSAAIHANVRYLGSIPKDDLREMLGAADVGINTHAPWPLLETTITGKLFDYLAAGLPVISIGDGQMGLILRTAGAGFVIKKHSPKTVCETIKVMQSLGPDGRRIMGLKGRDWIQRHMLTEVSAVEMRLALDQLSKLSTGRRYRRLFRCSFNACIDLLMRRSFKAIKTLFADTSRQDTIFKAFTEWLSKQVSQQTKDTKLAVMPKLFSNRGLPDK